MNRWVFAILLTLVSAPLFANRIDSLNTDKDVVEFLKSINPDFASERYDKIQLKPTETIRSELYCDGIAKLWQVKNWEKGDFNGDGRTDIVVILYWYDYGVYVVMDNGRNNFKLHALSYNIYEKCELAKPIISIGGQQLLLFSQKKR